MALSCSLKARTIACYVDTYNQVKKRMDKMIRGLKQPYTDKIVMDHVMNNCGRRIYYLIRWEARTVYHGTKGFCQRGTKGLGSLHGWHMVWIQAEVERDILENR